MFKNICLLSFDVEEWFQVENLKSVISRDNWYDKKTSVERNIQEILQLLEEYNVAATFFILGWICKRFPDLTKLISQKGHEIASHGYGHDQTHNLSNEDLAIDIKKSKQILEDITGREIFGYRAPNFSVDDRLINILMDQGFKYDSSYNPFKLNSRYGTINLKMEKVDKIFKISQDFFEIPLSTLKMFSMQFPISGGAYFRLLPYGIFENLVRKKIEKDGLYCFYLHPWELDPLQPRIKNIRLDYRIRHYTGLSKTKNKLELLINFLKEYGCEFLSMKDYITNVVSIRK